MFKQPQFDKEAVDARQLDPSKMSVAALECCKRSVICGIVKSIGLWLFNNTPDIKDAEKKMLTIINAFKSNKDLTPSECDWQYDNYFANLKSARFATDPDCCCPPCSSGYVSWYSVVSNLVDDTSCYEWTFCPSESEKLTQQENDLVARMRNAREEYYKVRNEFENYFRKVNQQALKSVVLKYGTTFQQIAPDWYKQIKDACGIGQPEEVKSNATIADEAQG